MHEEYDFHLKVLHDGSEESKEEYRQWRSYFKGIEDMAKGLKLEYSFEESLFLDGAVLSLYITGRDLYLGIWDKQTNTFSQEVKFDDVKYIGSNVFRGIENDAKLAFGGFEDINDKKRLQNNKALHIWPKQVVNIRKYESEMGIAHTQDIPSKRIEIPRGIKLS